MQVCAVCLTDFSEIVSAIVLTAVGTAAVVAAVAAAIVAATVSGFNMYRPSVLQRALITLHNLIECEGF